MRATHFVWTGVDATRVAAGYRTDSTPHPVWKPDAANAAHRAYTTPHDLARCLVALPGPDNAGNFLRPETRAERLRRQVTYLHLPALGWALGWGLQQTAGSFAIWRWGSGLETFAVAFPDHRFGIVLMTNSDNGLKVCERILTDAICGDHPIFSYRDSPESLAPWRQAAT